MRKCHFEGIKCQIDIGPVFVAAGGEIALDEADGMLGQSAAVFPGPCPIGICNFGDDFTALLERLENDADVEMLIDGGSDAYFNVGEVDENGDVDAFLLCQNVIPSESDALE